MRSFPHPFTLSFVGLLGLTMLLISCTKEEKLGLWLAKKGGEWNLIELTEQSVEYTGTDSLEGAVAGVADPEGLFAFDNAQGTVTYNFASAALDSTITGSGERVIVGSEFYFLHLTDPDAAGETVRTTMIGYQRTSGQLQITMRLESYNIQNQLFLVHKMELGLTRAD